MVKKVKFHAEEIKRIIREECTSLEEGTFSKMLAKAKKSDEKGTEVAASSSDQEGKDEEKGDQKADKPKDEDKKDEKKDLRGLKQLKPGTIQKALNQLRNQGIDSKKFREAIIKAIKTIHKKAGPQRKNFAKEDAPVIQRIGKEVIRILSGDFSNLVKESKQNYYVSPEAYEVVHSLAKEKKSIKLSIMRNKK
tara:strand:- start:3709 stop:4287 length:579 start_codon:yes stop_codon:yes gene_type:complete